MLIICHGLKETDFTVEFTDHKLTLGQDKSCGIIVDSSGVSPIHAQLTEHDGNLQLKDCGSFSGTFLNHVRLDDAEHPLEDGDVFQIGIRQVRVRFQSGQQAWLLDFLPDAPEEDTPDEETAMTVMADPKLKELISQDSSMLEENEPHFPHGIFSKGELIGKYMILKQIGKGGMGEIYLARHRTLGSLRALKILSPDLKQENSKFFARFLREAKLAAEIRHPNIVSVMDVETDETSGISYIVMEYIDGGSLRKILKSVNHLSEEQAVIIVEGVAAALQAAEENKIVHRDIKPDNIMFSGRGEVKLADLGIAKNDEEDSELTRTNVMIGTPAYLPPEQVQNAKNVDIRADIYSLGATFYEMLTGQHPYPGENTYAILHNLFSSPVPDPRALNPDISPETARIIMKMLAKSPEDRYQNASELIAVLESTYPPRTANESCELIKKAIAGICENNSSVNTDWPTSSQTSKGKTIQITFGKTFYMTMAAVLIAAAVSCGLYWFFLQQKNNIPDQRGIKSALEKPIRNKSESRPVLRIITTPDSEIRLEAENSGEIRTFSSGNGNKGISDLPTGNYRLVISKKKFIPVERYITLNDNTQISEILKPDIRVLTIYALPGTRIGISGQENRALNLTVPKNGQLEIPNLYRDSLQIRADLAGYEKTEQQVTLNQNQTIRLTQKRIQTTLNLKTVPLADVNLMTGDRCVYSAQSSNSGICRITNINAEKYRLVISCPGYHTSKVDCDLSANQDISIILEKITFELQVQTEPDARIMVSYENKLQGTYIVPHTGLLKLPGLVSGQYSVSGEKKGFLRKRLTVRLDRNLTVDCSLSREPEKPKPVSAAPVKASGILKIYLLALPELMQYISRNGVEIQIGSRTWKDVRKFPWIYESDAGKTRVHIKSAAIREVPAKDFTIRPGRENEMLFELEAIPSTVKFLSNRQDAVIRFNGKKLNSGDQVSIETFKEFQAEAVYHDDRIVRSVISRQPGSMVTVRFTFTEKRHPKEDQYQAALKLYKERKYKEALKLFEDAGNGGHKEAALKAAEFYEHGLGMWFSDSKKALSWYWKAAELGDPDSSIKVAKAIEDGDCEGTPAQMIKFFLAALSLKNAAIIYKISNYYKNGFKDIPPDDSKALHYLKIAAELGHPDAMFDLGIRYEKGSGVTFNTQTALKWIEKAASCGHEQAQRYQKQLKNQ